MLKIYGYAQSINVRKVLWACEELGLAFERQDWGGAFRSTSEPQFRALNPVGMVPVIDDDGEVVWESNVIVRYLATSRGRTDLLPTEPAPRARVEPVQLHVVALGIQRGGFTLAEQGTATESDDDFHDTPRFTGAQGLAHAVKLTLLNAPKPGRPHKSRA